MDPERPAATRPPADARRSAEAAGSGPSLARPAGEAAGRARGRAGRSVAPADRSAGPTRPVRHTLRGGGYEAEVAEVGATLTGLRRGDRELVLRTPPGELPVGFAGAVLAPWPNRLRDGRYTLAGVSHQVPVNEPDRGTALHGLVTWLPWRVVEPARPGAAGEPVTPTASPPGSGAPPEAGTAGAPGSSLTLGTVLPRQPGYPSDLAITAEYAVGPRGLVTTVTATNVGDRPAPYGVGGHPYLVAGAGRVDDWTLHLPAGALAVVDGRGLATGGVSPVAGTAYDFRVPGRVGDRQVDDAFAAVEPDPAGTVTVRVTAADGTGVALSAAASWARWWQVFTADAMPGGLERAGLAVEPMSCPPDAFTSGVDVVTLEPGDSHEASWTIRAVG